MPHFVALKCYVVTTTNHLSFCEPALDLFSNDRENCSSKNLGLNRGVCADGA